MFSAIRQGKKPTDVFKKLVGAEPGLNNWELASRFVDSFENIDGEVIEIIWHWQRSGGRPGLADEEVDAMLLRLLHEAVKKGLSKPPAEAWLELTADGKDTVVGRRGRADAE